MSTTTLRTPAFVPDARSAPPQGTRVTSGPQAHRGLRYALLALVAAMVVFAALAGLALLRTQGTGIDSTVAGDVPTTTAALEAYVPGGSVYAAQVPTATDTQVMLSVPMAARLADAADARLMGAGALTLDGYVPGGSVYAAQVPMTRTTGLSGSLYDQQVPQAPTSGLTGSLYDQQVPSAARQ